MRVSPQGDGTLDVLAAFRDAIDGRRTPEAAFASIAARLPGAPCNGFWHGRPGVEFVCGSQRTAFAGEHTPWQFGDSPVT